MNKNQLLAFLVGLYAFIMLRPSFTWGVPGNLLLYFQIIPIAIFLPRLDLKKGGNGVYFAAFFALFLFICLLRGFNIQYSLFLLTFAFIPFVSKEFMAMCVDYFTKIYAVIIGISMVVAILVVMGVPLGGQIIPPLNELKDYNYISYPFLVIPTLTEFIRFHGPFDEPGVVGTVGFTLLVVNKYKLKNIWNILILISCIISFSFAFYAGTVIYLIVRFFTHREKSVGYLLLGAVVFYLVTSNIPVFHNIYSRFEYDESSGKLVGDDRTVEAQDAFFESIRGTSIYFWGTSSDDIREEMTGSAGYKKAIIQNGLVFMVLYCLMFWGFANHCKLRRDQLLILIALMLINFYHRPNMLSFTYILLYIGYIKLRACENEGLIEA